MKLAWQQIPSTIITEIFCNSNFDGVVLDLEHGCFNNESMFNCIQTARLCKKDVFIRVPYLDKSTIRIALDADVTGIILSTVETYDQALDFYNYCNYPFKLREEKFQADDRGIIRRSYSQIEGGARGQGLVRENSWGAKQLTLRKPVLIPQIETCTGVDNIDKISSIDFNYYLIGPYDLSASLGDVGNFKSSAFKQAVQTIKDRVRDRLGIHIPSDVTNSIQKPDMNDFKWHALGMDTTILVEAADVLSRYQ